MDLTRRSVLIGSAAAGAVAIGLAETPALRLLGLVSQTQRTRSSSPIVRVRDFGARGDGRTDDRAAIQLAIDTLAAQGGGAVQFTEGTYLVSRNKAGPFALQLRSNVHLRGDGAASVIKLADHASDRMGAHTLYIDRAENVSVSNLAIDGNRQNQRGSGHCLKSDGVDGLVLQNVVVSNAYSYGLGFQDGVNRRIRIHNVTIQNTGADGIDFKNKRNANEAIEISGVRVRRWGLRKDLKMQAAIDCRGYMKLSNIHISEPGAEDAIGIRMRQGEIRDQNGLGAHHASLENFQIRLGAGRAQVGVSVVARDVTIADGSISGGFRGLVIKDSAFRGSGIQINGCSDVGILVDAHGRGLDGDGAVLLNCAVIGCGSDGIQIEADEARLLDCVSSNNGEHGLLVKESATGTQVIGGNFSGNGRGPVVDRGMSSRISAVAG